MRESSRARPTVRRRCADGDFNLKLSERSTERRTIGGFNGLERNTKSNSALVTRYFANRNFAVRQTSRYFGHADFCHRATAPSASWQRAQRYPFPSHIVA